MRHPPVPAIVPAFFGQKPSPGGDVGSGTRATSIAACIITQGIRQVDAGWYDAVSRQGVCARAYRASGVQAGNQWQSSSTR